MAAGNREICVSCGGFGHLFSVRAHIGLIAGDFLMYAVFWLPLSGDSERIFFSFHSIVLGTFFLALCMSTRQHRDDIKVCPMSRTYVQAWEQS